jgi:hypothetical protein
MLYFRVGEIVLPPMTMALKCSFCPRMSEPGETIYVMETDPIHDLEEEKEVLQADREFETMCPECYTAIKNAALRHHEFLLYELDFQADGLRMAPEDLKAREF